MDQAPERRQSDRRQSDRHAVAGGPRGKGDRREGDRRAASAVLVAAAMALGTPATTAQADIFTRRTADGVLQATNRPDGGGYRLAYKSKGTVIHSREFQLRPSSNRAYDHHILQASAQHGVSVNLIRAVIQVESQFDRLAVSSAGAQGLMQLMPATARRFGVTDSFDARQNILGGTHYLRVLLELFRGNVALATAGFNAGENAVLRYGRIPPYRETQGYVRKILALLGAGSSPAPTLETSAAKAADAVVATPAAFYTPGVAPRTPRAGSRARVFYRWQDDKGMVHVAESPPAAGIAFTKIVSD